MVLESCFTINQLVNPISERSEMGVFIVPKVSVGMHLWTLQRPGFDVTLERGKDIPDGYRAQKH